MSKSAKQLEQPELTSLKEAIERTEWAMSCTRDNEGYDNLLAQEGVTSAVAEDLISAIEVAWEYYSLDLTPEETLHLAKALLAAASPVGGVVRPCSRARSGGAPHVR